jgi:hypothetical protein
MRPVTAVATCLDLTEYRMRLSRSLSPGEATRLRGFFGQAFGEEILLHHHHADGRLLYAYPRVQFKVLDRTAHLIGLAEGAGLVTRLWAEVDHARLGEEQLPVLEAGLARRREEIGETDEAIPYGLLTPWLGLNQDNFSLYRRLHSEAERRALLERVLVGNCLSLARAFGHQVRLRLTADGRGLRPWRTRLKGVPMLGFLGTFRVNFRLPDRVGIGKSVSRGFGTVERRGEAC